MCVFSEIIFRQFGGFATSQSQLSLLWILVFYADARCLYNLKSIVGMVPQNTSQSHRFVGSRETFPEIHDVISFFSANVEVIRGSLNIHLLRWNLNQLLLYNQNLLSQNQRRSPCQRRKEVFLSLVRFLVVVGGDCCCCSSSKEKKTKNNKKSGISGFLMFTLVCL